MTLDVVKNLLCGDEEEVLTFIIMTCKAFILRGCMFT